MKIRSRKTTIATIIVSVTLIFGGISACTPANSSDSPQSISPSNSVPASSTSPEPLPVSAPKNPNADPSNVDKSNPNSTDREQAREARRKQVEAVLNPSQVQQLQEKMKQGEKLRKAVTTLNLTTEQKTKIQMIFEKSYEQTPYPDKLPDK
ncbi:hypothetical protein [Pseudanabaena sp. 'Roaring Creek']|uniref:hypothetical protein n=1 Tax=Pseudanabaena sp. 'Roaring Creek' TaxID=1681830 RepID=UPI0006D861C9|nr:hypothetical protein [Pseudanabaena sp. 'Roaring Creek']